MNFRNVFLRLFINFNRFTYSSTDNVETPGIRPSGDSISNIPQVLEGWHHRSLSAQADSVKDTDVFPRHRKSATEGVGVWAITIGLDLLLKNLMDQLLH